MKDDVNDGFSDGARNCIHEHTPKTRCEDFRKQLGDMATQVLAQRRKDLPLNWPENADLGEFNANIMLAYRHLEDARMRLGKAIQAFDGGISVYDK